MREIKFRAWCDVNGMTDCFCIHASGLFAYSNTDWVVDEEKPILMQYTGLKDKNGKEIYEGDILMPGKREIRFGDFISLDEDGIPFSQGNGFYTICHEIHMRPMPFSFAHRQSEDCEVVGNIHQNPELLNGNV